MSRRVFPSLCDKTPVNLYTPFIVASRRLLATAPRRLIQTIMGYDAIRDSYSSSQEPSPSPTLSKRGIAILLNDSGPSPTTPTTTAVPRPSTTPSPRSSTRPLRYDPIHHPDLPSPVDFASSSAAATISNSYFPVSPTRAPRPMHPPPPPRSAPTPISYNPRHRISPPKGILIPITPDELERLAQSHKNPLRKVAPDTASYFPSSSSSTSHDGGGGGWSPSQVTEELLPEDTSRRHSGTLPPSITHSPTRGTKRAASPPESSSIDHARLLHPSSRQNETLVAQHYNARPNIDKVSREQSPIIGLKNFNNWIKAVMIAKFARPAIRDTNNRKEGTEFFGRQKRPKYTGRVLDLGCGKGGDLGKWAKSDIAAYVGVDIADVSIDQARGRYMEGRKKPYDAEFYAMDCFSVSSTTFLSDSMD